jgi:ubiquinone/menaquinone biosynthesis C-methylase UbiE
MSERQQAYIPALSFRFLTPFFDFIQKYIVRDVRYKLLLIEQANIQPGQKVLDLGCGTGTLALMAKKAQPNADVIGLDADSQMLEMAVEKSASQNIEVKFDVGFTDKLPYPDASFDLVLSSIMIHHLKTPEKEQTAREVFR